MVNVLDIRYLLPGLLGLTSQRDLKHMSKTQKSEQSSTPFSNIKIQRRYDVILKAKDLFASSSSRKEALIIKRKNLVRILVLGSICRTSIAQLNFILFSHLLLPLPQHRVIHGKFSFITSRLSLRWCSFLPSWTINPMRVVFSIVGSTSTRTIVSGNNFSSTSHWMKNLDIKQKTCRHCRES